MAKQKKKPSEKSAAGGSAKARAPLRAVTAVTRPAETNDAIGDGESEDSTAAESSGISSSDDQSGPPAVVQKVSVASPRTRASSIESCLPSSRRQTADEPAVPLRTDVPTVPLRTSGSDTRWTWTVLAVLFVLVAVIFTVTFSFFETASPRQIHEVRDLRLKLRETFPTQPNRFYSTVTAAVRAVQTATSQPQPVPLLFVSNSSTDRLEVNGLAECLAHLLERNLTGQRSAIVIKGAAYRDFQPDESKYRIDEKLEAHFSVNSRVALMTDIEELSLDAAKLFYKYCDHENAPHKNVIFVLTITVVGDLTGSHSDPAVEAIEATVLKSWSPLLDEVAPILTRVANHMIVLRHLPKFDCKLDS